MRKSILIVDDDEFNRELLRQMFEDEFKILMAEDGKQAMSQLDQHMEDVAVGFNNACFKWISGA